MAEAVQFIKTETFRSLWTVRAPCRRRRGVFQARRALVHSVGRWNCL